MISLSGQIGNTESELKKLAEENPDLQEAYIAKQKRLKVSTPGCPQLTSAVSIKCSTFCKVSLFLDHLPLSIASPQCTAYLWRLPCFQNELFLIRFDSPT